MPFSGFAVSVKGASHEKSGLPCQDSARVYVRDGLAVAAVSDGHGSEKHFRSASGSEMAARIAIRSMTAFCERKGGLAGIFADDGLEDRFGRNVGGFSVRRWARASPLTAAAAFSVGAARPA